MKAAIVVTGVNVEMVSIDCRTDEIKSTKLAGRTNWMMMALGENSTMNIYWFRPDYWFDQGYFVDENKSHGFILFGE